MNFLVYEKLITVLTNQQIHSKTERIVVGDFFLLELINCSDMKYFFLQKDII